MNNCAFVRFPYRVFFALALSILALSGCSAPRYQVGVYYYPGWKDNAEQARAQPWEVIKSYPEREPFLGWYEEGSTDIAEQHVKWMSSYGIDFVIYDWYWKKNNQTRLSHALDAYLALKEKHGVKFSILWANHSEVPENYEQFDSMVDFWIKNLITDENFLKIDGRPAVFVFSPETLDRNARKFGSSGKILIERANAIARKWGFPGFFLIGSGNALVGQINNIHRDGYDAISAYNYHRGFSGKVDNRPLSRSYTELVDGYEESWKWILENSKIPYIVPLTSGWDKRPWQKSGVVDEHDKSYGNPSDFESHLKKSKMYMDAHPQKTIKMTVICCWNEFGEGSYIEPTKKDGFDYLDRVKKIFGKK